MVRTVSAIVIPTLGTRSSFLFECLSSIQQCNSVHICLVSPDIDLGTSLVKAGFIDQFVIDKGNGLSAAINDAMFELPSNIEYVNWLGDDDLLQADALHKSEDILKNNPKIGMVYGRCTYVDESLNPIWKNQSGHIAGLILRFGPCLVPQPGALFRRSVFNKVGGLRTELKWAFDLDLFIRIKKCSKLRYMPIDVSFFRWHPNSLSVGLREGSIREASQVRRSHLPKVLQAISLLWEFPVRKMTLVAGHIVSSKTKV